MADELCELLTLGHSNFRRHQMRRPAFHYQQIGLMRWLLTCRASALVIPFISLSLRVQLGRGMDGRSRGKRCRMPGMRGPTTVMLYLRRRLMLLLAQYIQHIQHDRWKSLTKICETIITGDRVAETVAYTTSIRDSNY